MRHAEKLETSQHLSAAGHLHAERLATTIVDKYGVPDVIYAATETEGSHRPFETARPLADKYGIKIKDKIDHADVKRLVKAVRKRAAKGKFVLVVWRHDELPDIARELGMKDVPDKWPDDDFSTRWEIDLDKDGEPLEKLDRAPIRRTTFQGFPISIENEAGTYREWDGGRTLMLWPYGYIRLSTGADGDHVDVYLGPDEGATHVYVVRQLDSETGQYDEDKAFLGFDSVLAARAAFLAHRDDGDSAFGGIDTYTVEEFRDKVHATADRPGAVKVWKGVEDEPRDAQGRWTGGGETLTQTLNRVGREVADRKERVSQALSAHPDGYQIKGARGRVWTKQTIGGDVFWTDGKRYLTGSQLLEREGTKYIEPHVPAKALAFKAWLKYSDDQPRDWHGRWMGSASDVRQPVHTKAELYDRSRVALEDMKDALDRGQGIGAQMGYKTETRPPEDLTHDEFAKPGGIVFIAPLKGEARAEEKVNADYHGDWSKLTDVTRATIAVDTMGELHSTFEALRSPDSGLEIVRTKDRFGKPTDMNYRDMLLNVRFSNGAICEVQLHLKSMLEAKNDGHHLYEQSRGIEARNTHAGKLFPFEQWSSSDRAAWTESVARQRELYDRAWERAGMGKSLAKYNEDQPRDEHGKWTSGGVKVGDEVSHLKHPGSHGTVTEVDAEGTATVHWDKPEGVSHGDFGVGYHTQPNLEVLGKDPPPKGTLTPEPGSHQLGSTPGGIYNDEAGNRYYVKFPQNPEQREAEIAAQNAYKAAGVETLTSHLVEVDGKPGIAANWTDVKSVGATGLKEWATAHPDEAGRVFAASVVTQNWDVVGKEYDNLVKFPDGQIGVVDTGGSFHFRAMGDPKPYTSTANEIDGLRSIATNPQAAMVFGKVLDSAAGRDAAFDTFAGLVKSYHDGDISPPSAIPKNLVMAKATDGTSTIAHMPPVASALSASEKQTISEGMKPVGSAVKPDGTTDIAKMSADAKTTDNGALLGKITKGAGLNVEWTGKEIPSGLKPGGAAYKAYEAMQTSKTVDEYFEKGKAGIPSDAKMGSGDVMNWLKAASDSGYVKVTNASGQEIKHQYGTHAPNIPGQHGVSAPKVSEGLKVGDEVTHSNFPGSHGVVTNISSSENHAIVGVQWDHPAGITSSSGWATHEGANLKPIGGSKESKPVASPPSRAALCTAAWNEPGWQSTSVYKQTGPRLRNYLMPEEAKAIIDYTDGLYSDVNSALGAGQNHEKADVLTRALTYHPDKYVGMTNRSDSLQYFPKDKIDFEKLKPGTVFENPVFWSTSTDPKSGSSLVWHIEGKTGVNVASMSNYHHEHEVLFRPRTKFEVIQAKTDAENKKWWHVFLREIGDKPLGSG